MTQLVSLVELATVEPEPEEVAHDLNYVMCAIELCTRPRNPVNLLTQHFLVVVEARAGSMAAKRKHLTLESKVKIISYAEENPKVGIRAIAETYGIGKTQVSDILRNKVSIKAAYASNFSTHKKCRVSKYSDVNEALYSWYNLACSKNIYPTGPQLVAKAKEIAQCLGKTDFEGTPGWLSKLKARYNIFPDNYKVEDK